jgi:uncharacterized membrane protein
MPRMIQLVVPSQVTTELLNALQQSGRALGIRLQPSGSVQPPGDVITIEVTDRALMDTLRLLDEYGLGRDPRFSMSTNLPLSVVSLPATRQLENDSSESSFEEMETSLVRESNTTGNVLLVMAIAGFTAVVGIATGAVHIVIGSMIIAPGFEPLVRIALGVSTARGAAWRGGLRCTAQAYAALVVGAAAAALILLGVGRPLFTGPGTYLPSAPLVTYWSTLNTSSVLISTAAAAAGAILIATSRSVLTAGVVVALGLIPAASLVPAALIAGQWRLAGLALLRWAVDAALVVLVSIAVFTWKRLRVHRRRTAL